MRGFLRGMFCVGAMIGMWGSARGAVVVQDRFDATLNFLPAVQTPVTDVYFFRGYTPTSTGTNLQTVGQVAGVVDIPTANGSGGFTSLLPAVQSPSNEEFGFVGFCDGSVVVALNFSRAASVEGNTGFNFQTTFGISEPDLITALANGDTATINTFFVNAYGSGLLPAVQSGQVSGGTLVGFSTPTELGSISVVENAPEPGTVGVVGAGLVLLMRRRRGF